MSAARWVVGLVAALVVVSAASGQAPGVDPKSLVGEWEGTVTGTSSTSVDVKYFLTLTRADGNKLFDKAQSFSGGREFPAYAVQ